MSDTILVVVEQREGKLNRVSWETITAGQKISAATGWALDAAVAGSAAASIAGEVAAKKVAKVYAVESPKLEPYTPDAFAAALKQFLTAKQPKLVLMPHTYQVRDFIPKLVTAMGRTVISDCIAFKHEGGKLMFTRQMFQGKLSADVSFTGDAPWFVTFQNGSFRGDQAESGASTAPVETIRVEIPDGVVRNQPQPAFKEAKQAVDLTQAEIIVSVGRGIKEQKNIELARQLADALGGEIAASRPVCDSGWLPMERQVGSSADGCAQTVSGAGNLRRDSAYCGNERVEGDHRGEQRFRSADFRNRRLCRGREPVRHHPAADRGSEEGQGGMKCLGLALPDWRSRYCYWA